MRLLRLLDGDFALEFHPYVTVVGGLDEATRRRVVEVIAELPRGRVGDLTGLVESHGVVLDLDAESLSLLELNNHEVDVVVTYGALPGNEGSSGGREFGGLEREAGELSEKLEAAQTEVLRRREAVEQAQREVERAAAAVSGLAAEPAEPAVVEAPETGDEPKTTDEPDERPGTGADERQAWQARVDELAAAASLLAETEAALELAQRRLTDAESATEHARTLRDGVTGEASALAGQLEAAEAGLDPDVAADIAVAEQRLIDIRQKVEEDRKAEQDGPAALDDHEPIEHQLARLEVQRTQLDAKLAVLGGAETLAVESALEGLRSSDGDEPAMVLSADALELADEIEALQSALDARSSGLADNEGTVIAARARLDAARQALAEIEQRVRLPLLDRDDIDALEVAHADVLDAQDKTEGRFSKARAGRRLDEAKAAEDVVLERLGFDSYADYMMGTSILHVDDEQEAALDVARSELADAEDAWAALQDGLTSTLESAKVQDEIRTLEKQAAELLGATPDGDVVEALRTHRIAAARIGDAHGSLVIAMHSVGLAVAHEDLEPDELVRMAEEWMEEEGSANALRDAAIADRAEVDLELAEARSQLSQAAAGLKGPSVEVRREARIDDAASARDAVLERQRRHGDTLIEVDELRASLSALTERVTAANAEVAASDSAVERAAAAVRDARSARDRTASAHQKLDHELSQLTPPAQDVPDEDPADVQPDTAEFDAQSDAEAERADLRAAERAEAMRTREVADAHLSSARQDLALAEAGSDELREQHAKLEVGLAEARATPAPNGADEPGATAEEVEWYLLSRLAAQRRISFAGSVPMVIDRALDSLTTDETHVVLDRLERMAAAVQLIVISDTDAARAWAERAGEQRGAVVEPIKPAEVVPFA